MKDVTQQKLIAANARIRQLENNLPQKDRLTTQLSLARRQVKFINQLLINRYNDIKRLQTNLRSAQNALIQKDAHIQKLQKHIRQQFDPTKGLYSLSGEPIDGKKRFPDLNDKVSLDDYLQQQIIDGQNELQMSPNVQDWSQKQILLYVLDKLEDLHELIFNDSEQNTVKINWVVQKKS